MRVCQKKKKKKPHTDPAPGDDGRKVTQANGRLWVKGWMEMGAGRTGGTVRVRSWFNV